MKKFFKIKNKKRKNYLILLIFIVLLISLFFYRKNNFRIKVIYITSGAAPYSEEVIDIISKNTKNKIIKNILIKECKPNSITIKRIDSKAEKIKYGESYWSSGFTGCTKDMTCVDGPVYYIKFKKCIF